ncbi:hypothetical protein UFOVP245_181 [uncultured Caudovirales phage]|uniref:Uncharacterized protein n=1 Tax=uncultured Caudovirales phage TaxID=2100421 RepID=A0A6J7WUV5_9CAUD|nr:hypothetical protein UFOVP245_181 [uncultured Caudovirales phage]
MSNTTKILGFIGAALLLVLVGPLLSIWAWNTLFGTLHTIPYSLDTWIAVSLLFNAVRFNAS